MTWYRSVDGTNFWEWIIIEGTHSNTQGHISQPIIQENSEYCKNGFYAILLFMFGAAVFLIRMSQIFLGLK